MTMRRRIRNISAVAGFLLGLGGCAGSDGPVVGSWQGRQPTGSGISPAFVTLVLHGNPGAVQGEYDIQAVVTQPIYNNFGGRNLTWGDRWTLLPGPTAGAPPLLELHNLPNSQISRYVLIPDGRLLPATREGTPDLSPGSLRYGLTPVPRNSWGYGRL